jgi:hypothetical protein
MAFVPGFKHDIFISYAYLNDRPMDGADGWVTRFHARLDAELRQHAGKELSIWRDLELWRNQLFDQTIKGAIDNAAIFLTINSRLHKQSDYCQQEIHWFCDRALVNNIPFSEWHPAFGGATGYRFFEDEPGDDLGFPADHDGKTFKTEMRVLVRELYRTLLAFKEAVEKKRRQPDIA